MCERYRGCWVALEGDEVTVIASGETAKEALKEAQQKGYRTPLLFHVPQAIVPYIGTPWVREHHPDAAS